MPEGFGRNLAFDWLELVTDYLYRIREFPSRPIVLKKVHKRSLLDSILRFLQEMGYK